MQLGRLITRSPRLQGLDLPLGNPVSKLMTQLHLRHSASSPFHRRASCVGACHRYHLLVCGTVYRLVIKLDLFVLNNLVDWKKERVVLFFPVQCNLCAENAQFFCLCFIDGKTANGDLSHLYQLEQSNDLWRLIPESLSGVQLVRRYLADMGNGVSGQQSRYIFVEIHGKVEKVRRVYEIFQVSVVQVYVHIQISLWEGALQLKWDSEGSADRTVDIMYRKNSFNVWSIFQK